MATLSYDGGARVVLVVPWSIHSIVAHLDGIVQLTSIVICIVVDKGVCGGHRFVVGRRNLSFVPTLTAVRTTGLAQQQRMQALFLFFQGWQPHVFGFVG